MLYNNISILNKITYINFQLERIRLALVIVIITYVAHEPITVDDPTQQRFVYSTFIFGDNG